MNAARQAQALRKYQLDVLKISLTPAPIALQVIDQRRRRRLVTAIDVARKPHLPARAAKQRSFDEIVTHDFSAERWPPREDGQSAIFHERFHPDDRVVPPVISVRSLQPRKARRVHLTVEPGCKLLTAREQRLPADQQRRRLNERRARVR